MIFKAVLVLSLVLWYADGAVSSTSRIRELLAGSGRPSKVTQLQLQEDLDSPFRKLLVLRDNVSMFFAKLIRQNNICGFATLEPSPDFDAFLKALPLDEFEGPFCWVASEELLPLICNIKSRCPAKDRANEFDMFFASFYVDSQINQNHTDPFICKRVAKEISGQIINPKAYDRYFDPTHDQFLAKELPCKAVADESVSMSRLIKRNRPLPDNDLSGENDDYVKLERLQYNIYVYYNSLAKNDDICGLPMEFPTPEFQGYLDELYEAIYNNNDSFCKVAAEHVLPLICKLKSLCIKKDRENELDVIFAQYYLIRQFNLSLIDPFICKDEAKEISGQIINPRAYTGYFDPSGDSLLVRSLSCKEEVVEDRSLSRLFKRSRILPGSKLDDENRRFYYFGTNVMGNYGILYNKDDICGLPMEFPSPEFQGYLDELDVAIYHTNNSYCEAASEHVVPLVCKLKSLCIKKDRANELDVIFAQFYYVRQLETKKTDPFICTNASKDISGEIINPQIYTDYFDYTKDPLLVKEIPCKNASGENMDLLQLLERNYISEVFKSSVDPWNLEDNIIRYWDQTQNNDTVCGIEFLDQKDPKIKQIFNKLVEAFANFTGDFCSRTFDEVLPGLCELKKYCKFNVKEIDLLFGNYYAENQINRKNPKPFSCKDKSGKELLGDIIQSKAYEPRYDLTKEPLLTRELPCKT